MWDGDTAGDGLTVALWWTGYKLAFCYHEKNRALPLKTAIVGEDFASKCFPIKDIPLDT